LLSHLPTLTTPLCSLVVHGSPSAKAIRSNIKKNET
jgi:hypothetical protein